MFATVSKQLTSNETTNFENWLSDIKSITSSIEASHQDIDEQRCLTEALLNELHGVGLFRLSLPREINGCELSPHQLSQVAEVLAKADASVGWCFGQGSGCAMSAAFLEPKTAKKVLVPKTRF